MLNRSLGCPCNLLGGATMIQHDLHPMDNNVETSHGGNSTEIPPPRFPPLVQVSRLYIMIPDVFQYIHFHLPHVT